MAGPLPMSEVHEAIVGLREKLTGDALKVAIDDLVGKQFDAATEKVHGYLAAGNLIREVPEEPAYFNVLSLGNWLIIALVADVKSVPARLLGVAPTQGLLADAMGSNRPKHFKEALEELDDAIQTIQDNEMLRFDACGSSALKQSISEGRGELMADSRGYIRSHNGRVDHILCERLADSFVWHPEDYMPVFARPIIKAKKRDGWTFHTGKAGKWPCEWRVYVANGEVVGVSNYYPQSGAEKSEVPVAMHAVELTETLMSAMDKLKLIPHHPRYEASLDASKASFSADFIEAENGDLLFLEAGPAHIYKPAFGASPCCFNPHDGVRGIALAPGVVLPLPTPNAKGD